MNKKIIARKLDYTVIPNILLNMKGEGVIDWIEFIVLNFVLGNKDVATSRVKIADAIKERRETVSNAVRSLQEKGFISIVNIDDKFIKINTIF